VVNEVYSRLEREDDKEDLGFSVLKLGMVLWRYRVYKRSQAQLQKACTSNLKQLLRHLKVQMMRNNRAAHTSSESDSDSDSSEEEPEEVVQVGFMRV